jgi:uncharacterized protein involved in outer membrane biogenesis
LWSVIQGSKVSIEAIHLTKPAFDVRILKDGTANYDIVKPDSLKKPEQVEAASPFELDLKNYTITDGTILYTDYESDMNAEIVGLALENQLPQLSDGAVLVLNSLHHFDTC